MKLWNKFAAKRAENTAISGGRSMVEMLGVLAIIGVLSVGAIAGYGTAMYKYRMNKTIQAFTDLLQNLAELSTKNWGEGAEFMGANVVKYGLLPASMCPEDYVSPIIGAAGSTCKLPVGEIAIEASVTSFSLQVFMYLFFFEGDIVKSCVDFLSHGWWNIYPQEWLRPGDDITGSYIAVAGENDSQLLWSVLADIIGEGKKDNITLSDIQNACDVCKGSDYCMIGVAINNEM